MTQLKTYLKRLKNPTVVLSIASQIVLLLSLLEIEIDTQTVSGIITGVLSILVTLGIMSNPDTVKKSYGDDIKFCENCHKKTNHARIAENMVCTNCLNAKQ